MAVVEHLLLPHISPRFNCTVTLKTRGTNSTQQSLALILASTSEFKPNRHRRTAPAYTTQHISHVHICNATLHTSRALCDCCCCRKSCAPGRHQCWKMLCCLFSCSGRRRRRPNHTTRPATPPPAPLLSGSNNVNEMMMIHKSEKPEPRGAQREEMLRTAARRLLAMLLLLCCLCCAAQTRGGLVCASVYGALCLCCADLSLSLSVLVSDTSGADRDTRRRERRRRWRYFLDTLRRTKLMTHCTNRRPVTVGQYTTTAIRGGHAFHVPLFKVASRE